MYSRSESMWLVRGGKAAQPDGHTLAWLWGALPPDIRLSPHLYLATNSAQGPWWILGGQSGCRVLRTYCQRAAAVPGAYRAGRPFRADADVPAWPQATWPGNHRVTVPGVSSVWY
nr:hypothetical protein [Escherichia coli]